MSTFDDYEDEDDIADVPEPQSNNLVNDLRSKLKAANKEARRAAELDAKIATYERRDSLRDSGLDSLNDRQRKALEATHEGAWTPEAIRTTAVELGFAEPLPPDVPAADVAAANRMAAASTGANTAPDRDAEIDAMIAGAKNESELMAVYRQSGRAIAGVE